MAYPLRARAAPGTVVTTVANRAVHPILDGSHAWKDTMEFAVGSKVIYPAHGTAEVIGRSVREVDGEKITYLELSVAAGDESWRGGALKVSVPEDRAEDLGVRPRSPSRRSTTSSPCWPCAPCACPPTGPGGSRTTRRR